MRMKIALLRIIGTSLHYDAHTIFGGDKLLSISNTTTLDFKWY
jgi:hypothetical protein